MPIKDPVRRNAFWRAAQQRRKLLTFSLLGGKCVCCGEIDPAFLTVDHINNDAKRDGVYGDPLYTIVRREPHRFRLMCWNCNSGRRHGLCPHEGFSVFDTTTWPQAEGILT